ELTLGDVAVISAQLLLGLQLYAVVREFAFAALAMLAGAIFASVHRAFRTTPDVLTHPAVDLVLGFYALGHSRPRSSMLLVRSRPPLFRPGRSRQANPRKRKACHGSRNARRTLKSAAGHARFRGDRRTCQTPEGSNIRLS